MEQKLLALFAEILDLEEESLLLDSSPDTIEEWDSLSTVQIVAEISQRFGCEIPFDKISELHCIADYLKYID